MSEKSCRAWKWFITLQHWSWQNNGYCTTSWLSSCHGPAPTLSSTSPLFQCFLPSNGAPENVDLADKRMQALTVPPLYSPFLSLSPGRPFPDLVNLCYILTRHLFTALIWAIVTLCAARSGLFWIRINVPDSEFIILSIKLNASMAACIKVSTKFRGTQYLEKKDTEFWISVSSPCRTCLSALSHVYYKIRHYHIVDSQLQVSSCTDKHPNFRWRDFDETWGFAKFHWHLYCILYIISSRHFSPSPAITAYTAQLHAARHRVTLALCDHFFIGTHEGFYIQTCCKNN